MSIVPKKKIKNFFFLLFFSAIPLCALAGNHNACVSYNQQARDKNMPKFKKFGSVQAANAYSDRLKQSFLVIAKNVRMEITVDEKNEKYWQDYVNKVHDAIPSGKELMVFDELLCQENISMLDIMISPALDDFFHRTEAADSAQIHFGNVTRLYLELETLLNSQVGGIGNYAWIMLVGKERSAIFSSLKSEVLFVR